MSETRSRRCSSCSQKPCVCPCKHCNAGSAKSDCNCTPKDKFIRLANSRGDKFIKQCKLLKTLGDSYAYTIEPELALELLENFESKLEEVRLAWEAKIAKVRASQAAESAEAVSVE